MCVSIRKENEQYRILLQCFTVLLFLIIRTSSDSDTDQCSWAAGECAPDGVLEHVHPTAHCEGYNLSVLYFPLRGSLHNHRAVDRKSAASLDHETFQHSYVYPNQPVLIAGAAAALFKDAWSAWTFEELMSHPHGDILFPVKQRRTRLVGPPEAELNVTGIYSQSSRTILFQGVPLQFLLGGSSADMLGKGKAKAKSGKGRLEAPFNLKLHKEYFAKLKWPNFLRNEKEPRDLGGSSFNLHLSNRGGAIPHSHTTTLNVLFEGAKRWLLVNPLDYPSLHAREKFEQIDKMVEQRHASIEGEPYTSQVWYRDDAEEVLKTWGVPYYEFIQNEGDAVFIPDYFTHATMDLCRTTLGVELMGNIVNSGFTPKETAHFAEWGVQDA